MSQTKLLPCDYIIAERDLRSAMCLFFVQTFALQFVGLEFQMCLNLFSKILRTPPALEHDSGLLAAYTPATLQNQAHRLRQPLALGGLIPDLFASLCRQRIETRLPIVLADARLSTDELLVFEALKG